MGAQEEQERAGIGRQSRAAMGAGMTPRPSWIEQDGSGDGERHQD